MSLRAECPGCGSEVLVLGHTCEPSPPGVVLGEGGQSLFAITAPEMLELAAHCAGASAWYRMNSEGGKSARRWEARLHRAHREMFPEQYEGSGDDTRSANRVSSRR